MVCVKGVMTDTHSIFSMREDKYEIDARMGDGHLV